MAKFHGNIGFAIQVETKPGVWKDTLSTKTYSGDMEKLNRRTNPSENLNDNITMGMEISIIADAYANNNIQAIRYVEFMGAKWKVTMVTPQHPRLILTTGGVYNGK